MDEYPDCAVYTGTIRISGTVTNLSALGNITSIGGDLVISNLSNDLDAGGLSSLTSVGGDLIIDGCKNVGSLGTALEQIGGDLVIENMLTYQISGFANLLKVGSISITAIDGLTIPSFDRLAESGNLLIDGNILINNKLNALRTISGYLALSTSDVAIDFPALEMVTNDFSIHQMPALQSISGFDKLTQIGGRFNISNNAQLTEISGFANLQHTAPEETFRISSNDLLESIDGFQNSTFANGNITIENNNALTTIEGFAGIGAFSTSINISYHPNLVSLNAFNGVEHFNGNISISSVPGAPFAASIFQNVATITGKTNIHGCNLEPLSFNKLTSTTDELRLSNVGNLPPFDELLEVGGGLYLSVTHNAIHSFNHLMTIAGTLRFEDENGLEIIQGFNSLENVGPIHFPLSGLKVIDGFNGLKTRSSLTFTGYPDLEEINGFNNLETLGSLNFEENPRLKGVSGFLNLSALNTLIISANPKLEYIPYFNRVAGNLTLNLFNNAQLDSLIGFNAVEELSPLSFHSALPLDQFRYVSGFNGLKRLNYAFYLVSERLEHIEGFQSLEEIDGDLTYGALPNLLSSTPSFDNLISVEDINVNADFPFDHIAEFPMLVRASSLNIRALKTLSGFNALQSCGFFSLNNNLTIETIEGFEQLKTAWGIWIEDNPLLREISSFPSLESISRNLHVYDNVSLEHLNGFNNLVHITEQLRLSGNTALREIIGFNALTSADVIRIWNSHPALDLVSGFNAMKESSDIKLSGKVITGFSHLERVSDVLQFFDTNTAEIHGFEMLVYAEYLSLRANQLVEYPKFESLTQAGVLSISALENLEIFSSFENVWNIGRLLIHGNTSLLEVPKFPALTNLNELSISTNENITLVDRFDQITSIPKVAFQGNPNLEAIKGFDALQSIEVLYISENPLLFSLEGFLDIEYFPGNPNSTIELVIRDNPLLSFCSVPAICTYLSEGNYASIANNAVGCNTTDEILEHCGIPKEVRIHTFLDENKNGIYEETEPNLAGIPLFIAPPTRTLLSNDHPLDLRSFFGSMQIELLDSYESWNLSTAETSYDLVLNAANQEQTVYFGFTPQSVYTSIEGVISAAPFRCNRNIVMDLDVKNMGTTTSDVVVYLTLDDRLENFTFTNQPDTTINDHKVGWNVNGLYPTAIINERIALTVPRVESLGDDPTLRFNVELYFTDELGETMVKEFDYSEAVRCSFDPNDKRSFPQKEFQYIAKDQPINYNIRFQNTGNDVAYDVVILDTISSLLDMSTFRLTGTSHPDDLQVYIDDDRRVSFEFIGIHLIDSLTNEPESHGYVSYQIYPATSVMDFDEITNSASIYFDANLPIHTNETLNLIGTDEDDDGFLIGVDCNDADAKINPDAIEIPDNDIDEDCDENMISSTLEINHSTIKIYPNPAVNFIIIDIDGRLDVQVSLYSLNGQLLKTAKNVSRMDVQSVGSGMYLLEIKDLTSGQKVYDKIVIGN